MHIAYITLCPCPSSVVLRPVDLQCQPSHNRLFRFLWGCVQRYEDHNARDGDNQAEDRYDNEEGYDDDAEAGEEYARRVDPDAELEKFVRAGNVLYPAAQALAKHLLKVAAAQCPETGYYIVVAATQTGTARPGKRVGLREPSSTVGWSASLDWVFRMVSELQEKCRQGILHPTNIKADFQRSSCAVQSERECLDFLCT